MRAAVYLWVVAAISVGTANAQTPLEAYEGCVAATLDRTVPTNCGRVEVIARNIVFQCTQQLLTLVQSMPPPKTLERAALPETPRLDGTEEIYSYLVKHWGFLSCIIKS